MDYIQLTTSSTPPTVITVTATTASTGTTTGTVGGNITALGSTNAAITERGAYYSATSGQAAAGTGTKVAASGTATGAYTTSLTGLTSNTLYYVAAYATSTDGTGRGSETSFTTQAAVATAAATSASYTTATAGGTITAGGAAAISDRGVYLSTTAGQVATGGGTKQAAATLTGTGAYTVSLTGLTPSTVYYVAAYTTNAGGTTYGTEQTFTTLTPAAPTVTTAAATAPTSTGVTLGGTATANGAAITEDGVVYSTTNMLPTTADTKVQMATGTPFSQAVPLAAGTYYVRAYAATGSTATGYGTAITVVVNDVPTITSLSPASILYGSGAQVLTINGTNFVSGSTATYNGTTKTVTFVSATQLTIPLTATNANTTGTFAVIVTNPTPGGGASNTATFTVAPIAPTATTNAASSVSYTTVTANGSVAVGSGNAAVTERGFFLSTTSGQVATGGGTKQVAATAASGTYTLALTGLTPGTTYYVAAYGTNSAGTSYGVEMSFTTTALTVPTVATATPGTFTSAGATLGGSVTSDGGATVTEDGVVYSTTNTNPTTADTKVQMATGTPFSQAVPLAAGTYYVRAYAFNSIGTGYGTATTLVVNGVPTITSLSPAAIVYGSGAQTLTINGTNFMSTSTATYGGTNKAVTFVSATQLTIPITTTNANTVGPVAVIVTNPTPGGGPSNTATFTVNAQVPTVTTTAATSINYTTATANGSVATGSGATITDRGVYYSTTAGVVATGGGTRQAATTATGTSSFTAALTGLTPGTTYYVAAYATNTGGTGYGTEVSFTATAPNPAPTISSLSPSPLNAGAAAQTLTITGTGFVSAAVTTATYNGTAKTTTFVSTTQLTIPLTLADLAVAGSYPVVVTNSAPGGGASSPVNLVVIDATPTITSIAPTSAGASTTIATLTVNGTGFSSASVITFAGTTLATTYVSATRLTASSVPVPATTGTYPVTVTNPAPGGTSAAATFTVNPAFAASVATFTGFTTAPGLASAAQSYTLSGAGLPAAGSVQVTLPASSGYEVSGDNVTFAQSLSLPYTGTTVSATVYVRLAATTASGTYSSKVITNTVFDNTSTATTTKATVTVSGVVGTVYTWIGGIGAAGSVSWASSSNWSPARISTASTDILQFSSTSTPTIFTSETIGQLRITNNAAIIIYQNGERTLTISDLAPGADLSIGAGSSLTLYNYNPSNPHGLTVQLSTGATAAVAGTLIFDALNSTAYATHVLQGSGSANSVEFASGSVFSARANFSGGAFGTSTTYSSNVIFRNGSRYEQIGGDNPFEQQGTAAITSFEPTSYYYFAPTSSIAASLSGRTYGTFEYALSGVSTSATGTDPVTFQGNLIVTSGTANITSNGGINLLGSLLVNGGTLNLSPSTGYTWQLNGTAAQTIGGTGGTLTLGSTLTVRVNNAAGVTLARPITVPGTLQLTSGNLTTDAANLLTVAALSTSDPGSATSFVNGPLARPTATGAATTVFPIGKDAAYRPLTLNTTAQTSTTVYRAEQFEGNPGQSGVDPFANDGTTLTRVSKVRSFTLTPYNAAGTTVTQPTGYTGTVTLSYGPDDVVTDPTTVVIAKRDNGAANWANFGYGGSSASTVTSGTITSFSDFALASTNPSTAVNPLPVSLTSFKATRNEHSVALTWTTASEQNSARFEVERSLDGASFGTVATVAAHGTSLTPLSYAALDRNAPTAALYYRLRLVDQDGSSRYSAVVVVAGEAAELTLSSNPAHGSVRLTTATATPYVVRSALGEVVLSGTTQAGNATTVELPGLAAGVYFFELQAPTGRVVRKLVKE